MRFAGFLFSPSFFFAVLVLFVAQWPPWFSWKEVAGGTLQCGDMSSQADPGHLGVRYHFQPSETVTR